MYIEKTIEAAENKYGLLSRKFWLYLLKSCFGGVFIVFGTIAAYSTANILFPINTGLATIGLAMVFTLALLSIIFLGGELFTSGVFVMAIGFYDKKFTLWQTVKTWIVCYFGNFAAIAFLLALYCLTKSYPSSLPEYVAYAVTPKLHYTIPQLLFKGMFCNFAVCGAYYATIRMTSETGKFLMICICIFSFVVSGFEHCIANMAYFTISFFIVEDFSVLLALRNILFSTIGNIIGGAILLGVPVYLLERKLDTGIHK